MIIKDKMELSKYSAPKFPRLKGHVKLTLHNCKNGKNEVIEGENIVTNALADIMAADYMGCIDYSKIFGSDGLWKKWYGGVLCYQSAHPLNNGVLDPAVYYPQADSANHLVAHAGQLSIDPEHDDDMARGNPIGASFVETENSIKQVFEWSTTHGNGTIAALSLCHSDVGSYGLGSDTYGFKNSFAPFDLIQSSVLTNSDINLVANDNLMAQYDDNHGLFFHIGEPEDWAVGQFCASIETTKITVCIKRLPYAKTGLFETMHPRSGHDRTFTVTISGVTGFSKLYCMPSFYFDYATKKLWLFTNNTAIMRWDGVAFDNQNVHCIVIDCENEEIDDEFLISSDDTDLVPLCEVLDAASSNPADGNQNRYQIANIVKDGNYVYFPTGTVPIGRLYSPKYNVTGYKKINISSQSDQDSLSFVSGVSQSELKSTIKAGGLLINSGIVVNGDTGYSCQSQFSGPSDQFCGVWCYQQRSGTSNLVFPLGCGNYSGTSSWNRYIAANKMLNTTKFNLPSPVQKTASQSMVVEYTLTEVSGS